MHDFVTLHDASEILNNSSQVSIIYVANLKTKGFEPRVFHDCSSWIRKKQVDKIKSCEDKIKKKFKRN